jgi:hypothetical protein
MKHTLCHDSEVGMEVRIGKWPYEARKQLIGRTIRTCHRREWKRLRREQ